MRPIPYPADTKAKGWRFELDLERVMQSDTWALAAPDVRPWLLMLWTTAWQQNPCGSMPSDDTLLAARLGMAPKVFAKAKSVLLRGWWLAEDGRLYHDTIVERVVDMLRQRDAERNRKAAYRTKLEADRKAAASNSVPQMSHGTDDGQPWDSGGIDATRTSTRTSTSTSTGLSSKELQSSRQCAGDDEKPNSPAAWSQVFAGEFGVDVDHRSIHDRKKFWPLATAWAASGVTVGQMRAACAKAQAEATEPIAWLPAYVDRVLASMQAQKAPAPEPEWRTAERERMQVASPRMAARGPSNPETFDVEARNVTAIGLD